MEIRSYRAVFDLERRIYRIDRLRLNPGGVPVRAVVYFLAILLAAAVIGSLPGIGAAIRVLPWYLRDLAGPALGAALLTVLRIDGRPSHLAASSMIRFVTGPRRLCTGIGCQPPGLAWCPPPLLMLPDGSEARMRRLRYTGPGAVRVNAAHQVIEWRRGPLAALPRSSQLSLRELPGGTLKTARLIELPASTSLTVL